MDGEEHLPGECLPARLRSEAVVEGLAVLRTSVVLLTVDNKTNSNLTPGDLQV